MTFVPILGGVAASTALDRRDFGAMTTQDLVALAMLGFEAIEAGDPKDAKPIFDLLIKAQPENAAGSVGMALIEYGEGSSTAAIQRLKNAARAATRSVDEAKATLVVLLATEGRRTEAAELRRELLRGPDSSARRMVEGLQLGPKSG